MTVIHPNKRFFLYVISWHRSEHNFGYDTLKINRSKSGEEDDNSFFTAHDDNDGKSQSTIGSKVSELRYNQILMDALKISQQRCLLLWTEKKEPSDKNDMLIQMIKHYNFIHNWL